MKSHHLILGIILLLFGGSCQKDDGGLGFATKKVFPLAVGNKWKYSLAIVPYRDYLHVDLEQYWEIIATDTVLGKNVFVMQQVQHDFSSNRYDTILEYLYPCDSGLFVLAFYSSKQTGYFGFFKQGTLLPYMTMNEHLFGKSSEKFVTVVPEKLLKYPMRNGDFWNRFAFNGSASFDVNVFSDSAMIAFNHQLYKSYGVVLNVPSQLNIKQYFHFGIGMLRSESLLTSLSNDSNSNQMDTSYLISTLKSYELH